MGLGPIIVEEFKQTPLEKQKLEIVERKGLGHPDFICDAILDQVSVRLNKEYINNFGAIMHYNTDKSLLVAGEVETKFGGGEVKRPMLLIFGDRATFEAEGISIPVDEIAVQAAKEWFKENLRFVNPEHHVQYQVELKQGSSALVDIFKRREKVLSANDTSAAVGYAPMSRTENLVLNIERYINSKDFKREFPESGEDVKVMGFRKNEKLNLTISMAFVDRFIKDENDYFRKKEEVLEKLKDFIKANSDFDWVSIALNTLDARGRGVSGVYLTVLGTSADGADSGQVGRGNRVNGVIPLNRHVSSEAAAGKNPVSHVGKIYNLLTHRMAEQIYNRVPGLEEVYVWLVSQIGRPIDDPALAMVQAIPQEGTTLNEIKRQIEDIVELELERIDRFCVELAQGKIPIC